VLPSCTCLLIAQQHLVIACLQRSLPTLPQLGMPAVCSYNGCACAAVVHVLANSAAATCHCPSAALLPHVATAVYARSMLHTTAAAHALPSLKCLLIAQQHFVIACLQRSLPTLPSQLLLLLCLLLPSGNYSGIAELACTPACFTGQLKGRRPGSFFGSVRLLLVVHPDSSTATHTSGVDSCVCMSL
jgi:hypothetical protein